MSTSANVVISTTGVWYLTDDIDSILTDWGKWTRTKSVPHTGYPAQIPTRRLMGAGVVAGASFDDDQGIEVERAIASLERRNADGERRASVVKHSYLRQRGERAIAHALRIPRGKVREDLAAARYWVECKLFG
jgi:hypothetical protein